MTLLEVLKREVHPEYTVKAFADFTAINEVTLRRWWESETRKPVVERLIKSASLEDANPKRQRGRPAQQ